MALVIFPLVSFILTNNGWSAVAGGGLRIVEWMSLLLLAFALFGIVQRLALASRLERGG